MIPQMEPFLPGSLPWRLSGSSSCVAPDAKLNNNLDNQDDYVKMSAKLV